MSAVLITDDLWLCDDCTIAQCNDDYTGMTEELAEFIQEALARMAVDGNLAANFDWHDGAGVDEFSPWPCDCCGTPLAGNRNRFALFAHRNPDQADLFQQEGA